MRKREGKGRIKIERKIGLEKKESKRREEEKGKGKKEKSRKNMGLVYGMYGSKKEGKGG